MNKLETGSISEPVEPKKTEVADVPLNRREEKTAVLVADMIEKSMRKDVRKEDEPFIAEKLAKIKNQAVRESKEIYGLIRADNPNIDPMPDEVAAIWNRRRDIVNLAAQELAGELSSELKRKGSSLEKYDYERDFSEKLGNVFNRHFRELSGVSQAEAVKKLKELYLATEKKQ